MGFFFFQAYESDGAGTERPRGSREGHQSCRNLSSSCFFFSFSKKTKKNCTPTERLRGSRAGHQSSESCVPMTMRRRRRRPCLVCGVWTGGTRHWPLHPRVLLSAPVWVDGIRIVCICICVYTYVYVCICVYMCIFQSSVVCACVGRRYTYCMYMYIDVCICMYM